MYYSPVEQDPNGYDPYNQPDPNAYQPYAPLQPRQPQPQPYVQTEANILEMPPQRTNAKLLAASFTALVIAAMAAGGFWLMRSASATPAPAAGSDRPLLQQRIEETDQAITELDQRIQSADAALKQKPEQQ